MIRTKRYLAFVGVLCAVSFMASANTHAQSCNVSEFPPTEGNNGYQVRTKGHTRCEGLYRSKISSHFEVVSFTQQAIPSQARTLQIQVDSALTAPSESLNLVASALLPTVYYRMDATMATNEIFQWPLEEVVTRIPDLRPNLGVVAWQAFNAGPLLFPINVIDPAHKPSSVDSSTQWGELIIRAPVDIETVYFYRQGNNADDEAIIDAFYAARQPIKVAIPRWMPQNKMGILAIEMQLKPSAEDEWLNQSLYLKVQ